MPNYLITGGAGFIGSYTAETLVRQGNFVRILDDCSTGKLRNLENIISKIDFIKGDIRDRHLVQKAVEDIDYVIHQAAISSVALSIDEPILVNEVNIMGILNILEASRYGNVKRIVFASSASVYGNSLEMPKKEGMTIEPISPYAVSKYIGEQYCRMFYKLYGLETVILRYFNVFGPRQNPNSPYAGVISNFINALIQNKPPVIFGDGQQSRDFVFVENIVQANLLACHKEDIAGEVFNIASGGSITINVLLNTIKGLIGTEVEHIYKQERKGDVKYSQADITKAREVLNYKLVVDLESGIEKTINWVKNLIECAKRE